MNAIKHLFDCWEEITLRLLGKHVMLFLDYDGTLAPLSARPESARLSGPMKMILSELNLAGDMSLAIVSGRALEDLKTRVGIPDFLYVGNHGFEMERLGFRHTHPEAWKAKEVIAEVFEILQSTFSSTNGAIVENKTFTLSLHYRLVPEERSEQVRMIFLQAIQPFLDASQVVFTEGKMVLEVRPALDWNKGTAVTWLYERTLETNPKLDIFPIYVGDDQTDESALKAVKDFGFGVKVAEKEIETHANYYLRNTNETYEFLKRLQRLKNSVQQER